MTDRPPGTAANSAAVVAPVAVVGYGMAVPGVNSPAELWSALHEATSQIGLPERFDIDALHHPGAEDVPDRVRGRKGGFITRFRPHPRIEAERERGLWRSSDEETLWLRHSLLQALDTTSLADGNRPGFYIGAWTGGSIALEDGLIGTSVAQGMAERLADDPISRQQHEKRLRDLIASRFRYAPSDLRHGMPHEIVRRAFEGVLPEDTDWLSLGAACASSLYAIDLGIQALYEGSCDVVFVGGVNAVARNMTLTADKFQGGSPTADVRPFDADANGTVFSDGAGVLALKLPARAEADGDRVLGVLSRPGLSVDGRGRAIAAPNPAGVRIAIHRGWRDAGLAGTGPDWVVAHGTGTRAGDSTEIEVLSGEAGRREDLLCSSNKSLVGHTGWVSGTVSVIHALLAMEHDEIPKQQRFTTPAPGLEGTSLRVPRTATPWPARPDRPRTAGVSSLGLGGVNGHVVVHDRLPRPHEGSTPETPAPARPYDLDRDPMVLVGWSAALPSAPDPEQLTRWLRTGADAPAASFGEHYPAPPIPVTRLSPVVTDVIDRAQILALDVAGRFVAEHGELWTGLRDTTGVIGAQSGVPRSLHDIMLRSGAAELEALFPRGTDRTALDEVLATVRARQDITEDSFAASTPSLAVNRIANRWDVHGPTLTLDNGPDSARVALRTARRYLADGRLDLVLLLALNPNAEQEAAWTTGVPEERLAEGAFLLALTRESVAHEHGWPIAARTDEALARVPDATAARDYYGAQGAVDLLRGVLADPPVPRPVTISPLTTSTRRWATALRRTDATTSANPQSQGLGTVEPDAFGSPSGVPQRGVVLVGSARLADELAERAHTLGALLISTDPSADPRLAEVVADLEDEAALAPLLKRLDGQAPQLRVLVRIEDAGRDWPEAAPELTRLLELTALCVKRLHGRIAAGTGSGAGSAVALILDPLAGCLPHPESALFTGFFRSLAQELPRERVLALVTDAALERALDELRVEASAGRNRPVVHYRAGLRYTEEFGLQPLPEADPACLAEALGERPVIVAAGGGRGITAVVLRELARRTSPTLWILGRTDPAEAPADILRVDDADEPRLRAAFLLDGRRKGERPADLARRFDEYWRAREVSQNLRELRLLCGEEDVRYLPCDVTDRAAVEAAADRIRAEGGRPVNLLLHTARFQESATLRQKSLIGFRRCLDTKVTAYRNLRSAFADEPPRLWVNFGSAVTALGLPGESDYGAANEFLAAAARYESRLRGGRELTLGWGLWEESGSAGGPTARERLAANGIRSGFTDSEGIAHFLAELAAGRPSEPSPLYLSTDQLTLGMDPADPADALDTPALLGSPDRKSGRSTEWRWSVDALHERYLTEHLLDGRPALPGAAMVSLAIEATRQMFPYAPVRGLRDIAFEEFVWADPRTATGPTKYRIRAEVSQVPRPAGEGGRVTVEVLSDITDRRGRVVRRDRRHARMEVLTGTPVGRKLTARLPDHDDMVPLSDPYSWPCAEIQLTGVFRNVVDLAWGERDARARWQAVPAPNDSISHAEVPVLLLDAMFRLSLFPLTENDTVTLRAPVRIDRIDLHEAGSDAEHAEAHPTGVLLHRDYATGTYTAAAPDGRVLLSLSGLETVPYGRPITPPAPHPARLGAGEGGTAMDDPFSGPALSKNPSPPTVRPGLHGPGEATGGLPYYEWTHVAMFGDTSAAGIVYYAELLNWIGHCREQWAFEAFPKYMDGLMTGKTLMLTDSVHLDYLGEMWANDRITVRMTIPWVRMHFMYGEFHIHRHTAAGEQLVAKGTQTWANATPGGEGEIGPAPWQPEVLAGLSVMGTDITRAWAAKPAPAPSNSERQQTMAPAAAPQAPGAPDPAALAFASRKVLQWIRCFDLDRDDVIHRDDLALAADRWAAAAGVVGDSDLAVQLRASLREVWDTAISPDGLHDKEGAGVMEILGRMGPMFADPGDPGVAAILHHGTLCFQVFDQDRDGFSSEGEFTSVMRKVFNIPEEFSIAAFRHADRDGDRLITAEDWVRLYTEFYTGTDPDSPAAHMLGRLHTD
ncbi:beta-ketoacyl synthase N-terminal-like domain-containing protein [Streptomyces sp. G1]|uniref:beta-ketoacyl synthase N-terminal-like domain-containing protein n=1 Tax=Streptomyces sp. G1 TaxID=361572 RepID=UPI0020300E5F|nr:beta-ketoacyl synthase N-terminal-like domain-containing protein [Streptomyces sp. G1]MCM1965107.1 KR domain-containing protein [Streptomyces sp. G1]